MSAGRPFTIDILSISRVKKQRDLLISSDLEFFSLAYAQELRSKKTFNQPRPKRGLENLLVSVSSHVEMQ